MNWQPIKTYNIDTHGQVLLFNEKSGAMYVGLYSHGVIQFSGGKPMSGNPTHWAPKPEAPTNPYNRNTLWQDHFGNKRKIRDLDDTHVANIIKWFPTSHLRAETRLLEVFHAELKLRGLEKAFTDAAYIPYKGPDGEWYVNMKKVSNKGSENK